MNRLERLEAFMRRQSLEFPPSVPGSGLAGLPPMAGIFVRATRTAMVPPTQEQFIQRVAAEDHVNGIEIVRARASRAYTAFMRQWHLLVHLETRARVEGTYWIPDLDYQGVDLLVLNQGRVVGVGLGMRSDAAGYWQDVKAQRHPTLRGLPMVFLHVDPQTASAVGEFWVHGIGDVEVVERAVGPEMLLMPAQGELLDLVANLKHNGQLRPKAGIKDVWPVLEAVVEWMRLRRSTPV